MATRGRPRITYKITTKEHHGAPREEVGFLYHVARALGVSLSYARLLVWSSKGAPFTRTIPMDDGDGDIMITIERVPNGE